MHNIAIVGQPNSGKSTIFNFLTGMNQTVGNWPGVTVEKKEGRANLGNDEVNIIDLPGVYGLTPLTPDEAVTRSYLLDEKVDLVINVLDGTAMERSLFLSIQLLFMKLPVIYFINMSDVVKRKNIEIETNRLSELLGERVILGSGRTEEGLDSLKREISRMLAEEVSPKNKIGIEYDNPIFKKINTIASILSSWRETEKFSSFFSLKLIEDDEEIKERMKKILCESRLGEIEGMISSDEKSSFKVVDWLYSISRGISGEVVTKGRLSYIPMTEQLDNVFLSRYFAIPIFLALFLMIFFLTFNVGGHINNFLELVFHNLSLFVSGHVSSKFISDFLTIGIIGGVGSVLTLIPYIFIMFFLLQILEDTGYMARIAFVMDKHMHKMGLHGKSFIPVIMGFGCSVPAVLAARTLETRSDRIKTILLIPFIPCSSRLTVIILLSGAVFGSSAPLYIFTLFILSIMMAVLSGLIFGKFFYRERSEGLIMELPDYKAPNLKHLLVNSYFKIEDFLKKAGTLIFFISIIIFFASYFPLGNRGGAIDYIGHFLNPLFRPLGFDTEMTVSLITGFFAKESVISTLSVLYNADPLTGYISSHWTSQNGFTFLLFMMIYIPCIATAVVIKEETKSWRFLFGLIAYSILLAYGISFLARIIFGIVF
ncbi:MAG: ferrous iron transport protein B [bacterium]|nr:ferrous iron transport protein B [bacterium]